MIRTRSRQNLGRRLSVVTASLAASVLVLVGSATPAIADTGPSIEDRPEAFADIVESLGLDSALAAQDLTGSWPTLPAIAVPEGQPAEPPTEDEEVVVLTEEEPPTSPASLTAPADDPPPIPEPVDVDLGGLDVTVAPTDDLAATPDAIRLRVAGEAETAEAGVTGILLDIVDESETPAAEDPIVELTVSYETIVGLAGGDWASRLRFVWIPACEEATACPPVEIETRNDLFDQTVTAIVPVTAAGSASTASLASLSSGSSVAETGGGGGSLAVTGAASGSGGDWAATSLSASATWGGGGSTGAFSWSSSLIPPTVPGGLEPTLELSYSSSASDGRIPSANNQSGVLGEGFDLTTSYIERSYVPCDQDKHGSASNASIQSGDLCWGTENATMMFQGSAIELIREGNTGVWHSKYDDGALVQHVTGGAWNGGDANEYWTVTTTDGTRYVFGRGGRSSSDAALNSAWTVPVFGNHSNEPCHATTFENSRCNQVWRWNLEYVTDTDGNSMTFSYEKETNYYLADAWENESLAPVSYTSGGRLKRIEFGTRAGEEGEDAPAHIAFTTLPRCITNIAVADSWCTSTQTSTSSHEWLDTPTDLICSSEPGECFNPSPTFFDRYRLDSVTSYADGMPLDRWKFTQYFSAQGPGSVDDATGAMLVLRSVTHIGMGGTSADSDDISLPPTQFGYNYFAGRIGLESDGHEPMVRPRVTAVRTDSGAAITVNYRTECAPGDTPGTSDAAQAANTRLCFPVEWSPLPDQPRTDYFHKYVVDTLVEIGAATAIGGELITGSLPKVTTYAYEGPAFWAKPTGAMVKPKEVTYSDFRGFETLVTTVGTGDDVSSTRTRFFRGTDAVLAAGPADHTVTAIDKLRFQGQTFSVVTLNGSAIVNETVTVPGDPIDTATNNNGATATRIPSATTRTFSFKANGQLEYRTKSVTTENSDGLPVTIDDSGDLSTAADDKCTTITYASGTALASKHIVSVPAATEVVSKPCGASVSRPVDVITRTATTYDDAGRPLRDERLDPVDGVGMVLVEEVLQYDQFGRARSLSDALGQVTTTAYQDVDGLTQSFTTTTPDPDGAGPLSGFASVTNLNRFTAAVTSAVDPNGRATTATYDSLGRLITVRYPQHANHPLPSVEYAYTVQPNGLNAVTTKTLSSDGLRQHLSVVLYDGLLRAFQTQNEGFAAGPNHNAVGADLGRTVTHTYYDSAGRVMTQTGKWWAEGVPSATPIVPNTVPPSQTTFEFDGAGRTTAQIFWIGNTSNSAHEKWRTITHFDGATTLSIPPLGSTPQATTVDAAGRTIELRQYVRDADAPSPAVDVIGVLQLTPQSTTFEYTPAGQMSAVHDAAGNDWAYTYDWGGRQVSVNDPDAGISTSTFDGLDRLVTRQDGRGNVVANTYDGIGRTLTIRDDSTTGPIRAQWQYDQTLDTQNHVVIGALTSSTRFVGGVAYTTTVDRYDLAGRPLETTVTLPETETFQALADHSFTTKTTYSIGGLVESISLPAVSAADGTKAIGAETVTTRYDTTDSPTWMSGGFGWGVYVAHSAYDPEGRPVAIDMGNTYGAVSSYQYESGTNRLTSIRLDRQGYTEPALDLHYSYDAAGNIVSVKDTPSAATAAQENQCFGYDGLQRLDLAWTAFAGSCGIDKNSIAKADVGGVSPYWTEYGYDLVGNRTSMIEHAIGSQMSDTVTSYAHANASAHQVTSTTTSTGGATMTQAYTYDGSGNRKTTSVGGETTEYHWNAEGKLAGIDDDTNVYDVAGGRLVRVQGDAVTVYLPGGQEIDIAGEQVTATRYYSFAGKTVAVRTGSGLGAVSSLATDHQDSVVASIPNTAWGPNDVERIYTDPFGGAREGSDTGIPGDHRFLSAVRDADSGLTLLGARFYDEEVGRFISVDPVIDPAAPAQINAYSYGWNNPVTHSDPTGLRPLGATDSPGKGSGGRGKKRQDPPKTAAGSIRKSLSKPLNPFEQFINDAGETEAGQFWNEDPIGATRDEEGVLRSDPLPPQLLLGYMNLYDKGLDLVTGMDFRKYPFNYKGYSCVLWVWKGDYPSWGAGTEGGFYVRPGQVDPYKDDGLPWLALPMEDMPKTSVSLSSLSRGDIASFAPEKPQVWTGVWHTAYQRMNVDDLISTQTFVMSDDMYDVFEQTWGGGRAPDLSFDPKNNTVVSQFRRRRRDL